MSNPGPPDFIAERQFLLVATDGRETSIHARLGRPYADRPRGNLVWRCLVALDGLAEPVAVGGECSLQALALGVSLAHQRLAIELTRGGRLLDPESRDEFTAETLRAAFGR